MFSNAAASCPLAPLPLIVPLPLATLLSYALRIDNYDDVVVALEAAINFGGGSKEGTLCWAVVVGGQVTQSWQEDKVPRIVT